MSKKKRESRVLGSAQKRLTGLTSISETLNLGNGISVTAFTEAVTELSAANNNYNKLLSDTDAALIKTKSLESNMRDLMDRSLAAVKVKYGANSTQYAQAGGTRKVDRKKRGQGAKAKAKKAAAANQPKTQSTQQSSTQSAQQETQASDKAGVTNGQTNGASQNGVTQQ